jgi:hypothetical protein
VVLPQQSTNHKHLCDAWRLQFELVLNTRHSHWQEAVESTMVVSRYMPVSIFHTLSALHSCCNRRLCQFDGGQLFFEPKVVELPLQA